MRAKLIAALCCGTVFAVSAGSVRAADVPDFSGFWGRNAFDLERMQSGMTPIANIQTTADGAGDIQRPIGDSHNPLLKPEAAKIVEERTQKAIKGKIFPDPSARCASHPPPFIFGMQLGVEIFQRKDEIVFLYNQDSQTRHVRLNAKHPAHLTPSWKGDSVAHYEGDTLVIDTAGIKTSPLAVMDRYGTPFGEGMHVVERYRLIDATDAKEAQTRHEKRDGRVGGGPGAMPIDEDFGKGLQLQLTIENPAYFTAPLSAQITYRRAKAIWGEQVCAESAAEQTGTLAIPVAGKPDF